MKPDSPHPPHAVPPSRLQQRKVFDVMRPGRAPAPSTSKPVIVGHKPVVRDASVKVNGIGERRPLMDSSKRVALQPSAAASAPAPVAPPSPVAARPAPAPEPAMQPPAPVQQPAPEQPVLAVPAAPSPSQPPVQPASAAQYSTPEDALLDDITPLVQEDHQEIVSRKVGHGEFPWKNTILALVILVLIAVLLDILVDAEFVSLPVPHTDFF